MDLGDGIALTAAAVNLSIGVLHGAIARAPGWRIARYFAAIALTAAGYNALSVVSRMRELPDSAYLFTANLSYLLVTAHAISWLLYTYADKHGSLAVTPKYIVWSATAAMALVIIFTATVWSFDSNIGIVSDGSAALGHRLPGVTLTGRAHWLAFLVLSGVAFLRLAIRFGRGEKALRWQVVFFGVFLLCAINELLVANRKTTIPSLIDFGLVLALMPLTLYTVRRISSDARRLRELSSYLKEEVTRRTEERDAARKALQETQEDLREVVSSLDEIVWEAEAQSLDILLVSAGAAKLLGYHSGDDRPTSFWPRYVHPEDRERLMVEARRAIRTNETVRVEHRMLTSDGRVLWFRDSLHPVVAPQGPPTRLRGVMSDITENRRAQDSLAESEARFQRIADAAPVLIWAHDQCGRVTYVNRQALVYHGRSLDQLRGDGWTELVHADDRERVRSVVSESLALQREYQMAFRQRRSDGEHRWMFGTAVPRFAGSEFAGHIGTVVDITQLKRDQEQGSAAQKLESLGALAGGVAHDFNNLLGRILADSELLLSDLAEDAQAREGIGRIHAIAGQAAEIVRELLTFASHENPTFGPVELSGLVREMLELLKSSISKHAVIRVSLPGNIPAVMASASQLRQVVMNLITNASEALHDGPGVISVTCELARIARDSPDRGDLAEGQYIRLKVSDTGCGMNKEVQERIFDPFFTTKFSGRGLGMVAVQGIVRSHRGAIHLTSAPGAGTCFEVVLPCVQEVYKAPEQNSSIKAAAMGTEDSKVLVVDDEEMLRIAVCKMLRKKNFSVLEAKDGHAALEIFRSRSLEIGVILLDMTLPGISGRKLFDELRRIRPDIRIILTTAYSKEMAANTLGGPQAWGFIRKPYHIADLVALLQRAHSHAEGK